MKALFVSAAVLVLLLGLGWLVVPEAMLQRWNMEENAAAVYMGRRYAGLLLGYAVLLWVARATPPSEARDAILVGGIAVTLIIGALSAYGALTGIAGPMMWLSVAIEVLLAAGFIWAWLSRRRAA
ncbi:MAG TPA: hypothetical protein VGF40_13865 [Thermoanaerobaculia bacterium]